MLLHSSRPGGVLLLLYDVRYIIYIHVRDIFYMLVVPYIVGIDISRFIYIECKGVCQEV